MTDSILIVGGGVAGLSAAKACVEAGARAVVVERDAIVGGKLAALMTQPAAGDGEGAGASVPRLEELRAANDVEILTLSDVQGIEGGPGNFTVEIRERARFVTDACTLCNHCRPVCPVVRPNDHDAGLTYRKAIYAPLADSLPQEFVIDIDACLNTPPNYLPCNQCTEVCDDDAIHFDVPLERQHRKHVAAVILATGFAASTADLSDSSGYGKHPDIVTTAELERLLMSPGPSGGFAAKPSNEDYPNSVLFILDALEPHAVQTVASQIERLIAQDIGRIAVLVTDQPGTAAAAVECLPAGLSVSYGLLRKVEPQPDQRLMVTFADFSSSRIPEEAYDLVVVQAAVEPADGLDALAEVMGCDIDAAGFVARPDPESAAATSRDGVYVAGAARGGVHLAEACEDARTAAAAALSNLDPRLLKAGTAAVASEEQDVETDTLAAEELRQRFERALFAMLESGK